MGAASASSCMPGSMSSSPRYASIGGNRIPVELLNDAPFRFLAEASEGRSKAALLHGQRVSIYRPRQRFLDLVKGKFPREEVANLVFTISAAIQLLDRIPTTRITDYLYLDALLSFLKEYDLVSQNGFKRVSKGIKARINVKAGIFEAYLAEWNGKTQRESFDHRAV